MTRSRLFWLVCFFVAFHPNCMRECPDGCGGCTCRWAWEDCPANTGGCNSGSGCNTSSGASALTDVPTESPMPDEEAGATHTHATTVVDPNVVEPGGTLAFVATSSVTFAVAAVGVDDAVRVVRVDEGPLDDDPVTVRTVGRLALSSGDDPARVVAGRGRAFVALRGGGAVVSIDPLEAAIVSREPTCASPRGLALVGDVVRVACASGDLVTLGGSAPPLSVRMPLDDVAQVGGSLVASGGGRLFVVDPSGAVSSHDPGGAIAALRSSTRGTLVAVADRVATFDRDHLAEATVLPDAIDDLAVLDDAAAAVAGGDAFFRDRAASPFARVGTPGIARAVALADVTAENVTRRLLAVQTDRPRMLVFFTTTGAPTAVAFEPLE